MKINSDINVLGGLPDWNLIKLFFFKNVNTVVEEGGFHLHTSIKTDKSVKRFQGAITSSILKFDNEEIKSLFKSLIENEDFTTDTRVFIFWNTSVNNELLHYLNTHVFFPAFYSGRVTLRVEEVVACLKELRQTEPRLQKWSENTIKTTASKYLTFLKKIGLMEGSVNKSIIHPYLNDKMFIHFVYWLAVITEKPNLLISEWLKYNFSDQQIFIDRILKKRYSKFFNVVYTGDKLNIETLIPYSEIYEESIKS